MTTPAGLAGATLRLARAGCYIHPAVPGGKAPMTEHGCHDATRDPATIRAWWHRTPAANIAVACGPTGLAVIDLDGPEAVDAWQDLLAEHPNTPRTLTVSTPRAGGFHLYYLADPDRPVPNSAGKLAPHVDIRAAGGSVICPPSRRPDGNYDWCDGFDLDVLPKVPAWVPDALARPGAEAVRAAAPPSLSRRPAGNGYAEAALQGEVAAVLDAVPGTRNDALCRAAFNLGTLVGAGMLDDSLARAALALAGRAVGLGESETRATVQSGLAAGQAQPRRVA